MAKKKKKKNKKRRNQTKQNKVLETARIDDEDRTEPYPGDQADEHGNLDAVKALSERPGFDPNHVYAANQLYDTGMTILQVAASYGQRDAVQYLLDKCDADAAFPGLHGCTALHFATHQGHFATVRLLVHRLLATIGTVDQADENGYTSVLMAAHCGHVQIMRYLLDKGRGNARVASADGYTALHQAAFLGHAAVVLSLVRDYRVDPDFWNLRLKNGPLHDAVLGGHISTVKVLVLQGMADVEDLNANRVSPLCIALQTGSCAMVRCLVDDCQAQVRMVSQLLGRTALATAAEHGHLDILRYLVEEKKENVHDTDSEGQTVLHRAVEARHIHVIRWLVLKAGADADRDNRNLDTPLHLATNTGRLDIVRCLVQDGDACVNLPNSQFAMPLHLAAIAGHKQILKFLARQPDAVLNQEMTLNNSEETPVSILCARQSDRHPRLSNWLDQICVVCGKRGKKRCARCCTTRYCSKQCQIVDWPAEHQVICAQARARLKLLQGEIQADTETDTDSDPENDLD
jgi:ankyrin repeat protein